MASPSRSNSSKRPSGPRIHNPRSVESVTPPLPESREAVNASRPPPETTTASKEAKTALGILENGIAKAEGRAAQVLNLALGALVEGGAPPELAWPAASRGLVEAILRSRGAFATTLIERLMTYALGRGVEYFDAPAVRKIRNEAAAENFRFSAIIVGIATSVPFQMRSAPAPAAPSRAALDAVPAGDGRRAASSRGDN